MVDSKTFGFLQSGGIALAIGIALTIVFSILRLYVPDVFEHRRLLNTWKEYDDYNGRRVGLTQPQPTRSFFGWWKPLFQTSEEQIVRNIGLDAAVFIRFLRTCFVITGVLAVFSCTILMPSYGTSPRVDGTEDIETDTTDADKNNSVKFNNTDLEGLRIVSLAMVPPGSARLWATVVMEYLMAFLVVYFLTIDFSRFAEWRRDYRISETPANYAVVVLDIPENSRTVEDVRNRFERYFPNQVADVQLIRKCSKACKIQGKLDKAVANREAAEFVKDKKGEEPQTRPGMCGCLMLNKPKVNAIDHWTAEQERLTTELTEEGLEADLTHSAIVLFTNKKAASIAAQVNSQTTSTEWSVVRAGEPAATNWPAMDVPGIQAEVRSVAVAVFVVFFTIFWTIPAAFIVSLFSIEGVAKKLDWKFLNDFINSNKALVGLVEGLLPPVIMSVLVSLIPSLFRFLVKQERIVALETVERKTRDYFYIFTIYGNFFVIALGSAFLQDLDALTENFSNIFNELAKQVPASGIFFASFILIQAFISPMLQLSGIIRIILRWIFLKMAKTERQRRKARVGGNEFQYFRYSGQALMIMFLSLMYSSFSPLVLICGTAFFLVANFSFKYQILFMTHSPYEGGGNMFLGSYWGVIIGLCIHQGVTIAVLALKQVIAPSLLCIVPLVFTIISASVVSKRFQEISKHGSIDDLVQHHSRMNEIPSAYFSVYEQPAGKKNDYVNLNGLVKLDDVYPEVADYDHTDKCEDIASEHHDDHIGYVPDRAAQRKEV